MKEINFDKYNYPTILGIFPNVKADPESNISSTKNIRNLLAFVYTDENKENQEFILGEYDPKRIQKHALDTFESLKNCGRNLNSVSSKKYKNSDDTKVQESKQEILNQIYKQLGSDIQNLNINLTREGFEFFSNFNESNTKFNSIKTVERNTTTTDPNKEYTLKNLIAGKSDDFFRTYDQWRNLKEYSTPQNNTLDLKKMVRSPEESYLNPYAPKKDEHQKNISRI